MSTQRKSKSAIVPTAKLYPAPRIERWCRSRRIRLNCFVVRQNSIQRQQKMDRNVCRHFVLCVAARCTPHRRKESEGILESGSELQLKGMYLSPKINIGYARHRHGLRIFRAWLKSRKSKSRCKPIIRSASAISVCAGNYHFGFRSMPTRTANSYQQPRPILNLHPVKSL